MSRYSQYNKNDTYLANLNYANLQKEKRNKEELKEIELDRMAMEKLQIELDQEKQLEKERKNKIRKQQYEDYSNYFRQKYSETPQSKDNNINIKLGSEKRFIRKPSYQQQMENLCLNPTRDKNIYNQSPIQNYSEVGRQYQRGYSHGYNILTGEAYSSELQQGKTPITNSNINNKIDNNINNEKNKEQIYNNNYGNNNNNNNVSFSEKEDLRQYQEYMEMKRKKEQEEQEQEALYYMQQQQNQNQLEKEIEKEKNITSQKDNIPQYINNPQKQLNYNNKEYAPQEQINEKMRPNNNENIPLEYKDIYNQEKSQSNQQIPLEEIPPEYREMYQREKVREKEQRTPYQNQIEGINTYIPREKNNLIDKERISEDDYRQYLLSKQDIDNKEKEEENMEIYQNMLKEKEREQNEINQEKEKELYRQYLLEQQKQNQEQNQIREQEINQNQLYHETKEIKEERIPKREINEIKEDNRPINSFDDYYTQKNINNPEVQTELKNPQQNESENKFNNDIHPPYQEYPPEIPQNSYQNMYESSQEPLSEEQAYMMYQQQQQKRQEMEQIEMEKERARQILERQQQEKNIQQQNLNSNTENYYPSNYNNYSSPYSNPIYQESNKISEFNSAKMEYLKNKQKNLLTKDNIFSVSEIQKPSPKYNNEPLTNADRLRIQREYAQFLDKQINAKNLRENKNKNNGLNLVQSSGYEVEGPNPYEQMRNKHSKLRDIPQDPYSVKNYNISNNSYLSSNPITNPVNSYKFIDKRRVPSGRLQNSGSNIVGK